MAFFRNNFNAIYMKTIRRLYASEIECRVAQCGSKKDGAWCSLLLYKDARVDMRILDEVYGPMNWQREHMLIGDRLYCTISIYDEEKGQWVRKQDVGTESYTEKEKGQASDSFKRAGFNVGIGRELYTAPKIFINLNVGEFDDKGGKIVPKISFEVDDIDYDKAGNINRLVIKDGKGGVRYQLGSAAKKEVKQPTSLSAPSVEKEIMHVNHPKWNAMLQSILMGKCTLNAVKAKYFLPEADEIAAKEWLLTHNS